MCWARDLSRGARALERLQAQPHRSVQEGSQFSSPSARSRQSLLFRAFFRRVLAAAALNSRARSASAVFAPAQSGLCRPVPLAWSHPPSLVGHLDHSGVPLTQEASNQQLGLSLQEDQMEAIAQSVVAKLQASESHKRQEVAPVSKKAKAKSLKCRVCPLSSTSPSSSSESEIPRAHFFQEVQMVTREGFQGSQVEGALLS